MMHAICLQNCCRVGLQTLDAFTPTMSRWDATWDGCHYTFNAKCVEYDNPPFAWQWQGGVSHVMSMIYLNQLLQMCEARGR